VEEKVMGIVISMLAITAGAIMRYAVSAQGQGFNVHTTGMVLMVVGVIGAVLSIAFWASWGGFARTGRRGTVVGDQAVAVNGQRTTTVREREVL
jgi:hypothetical protein